MTTFAQAMAVLRPAFWFRLGEPSGTQMVDSSVNANHGTYTNAPGLAQTGLVTGDSNTSVRFTAASSQYGSVSGISAYQAGYGSMAIHFGIKTNGGGANGYVNEMNMAGSGWELAFDGDRLSARWPSVWGTAATSKRMDDDAVHSCWMVVDRIARLLYFEIDGKRQDDVASGASPLPIAQQGNFNLVPSGTMYVGCRDSGGPATFSNETLDEIAGWFATIPTYSQRMEISSLMLSGPTLSGISGRNSLWPQR